MTDARPQEEQELTLRFPWGDPQVVHSPSDLTSRQYKYLQWCLRAGLSSSQRYRLLSLLGFLTYEQARWWQKQKLIWVQENQRWP